MVTWKLPGYELGALGVPLDRAERRFVHDASKPSCAVCLAAQRGSAERLLMAGAWKTVVLAPQHGEVHGCMDAIHACFFTYILLTLLYLLACLLYNYLLAYIVCLLCVWLSWTLFGVEFDGRYSLESWPYFIGWSMVKKQSSISSTDRATILSHYSIIIIDNHHHYHPYHYYHHPYALLSLSSASIGSPTILP